MQVLAALVGLSGLFVPALFGARPPQVAVFLSNVTDESPLPYMQAEVGRLMGPEAILVWRNWKDRAAGGDYERVVTVNLKGRCSADPFGVPAIAGRERQALASTATSGDSVLPFAEVDCDALRSLMAPVLNHTDRSRWPQIFGRAMGRVLAHELYHMVAQTRTHSETGVAKASFRVCDLTAEHFEFSDAAVARLTPNGSGSQNETGARAIYEDAVGAGR